MLNAVAGAQYQWHWQDFGVQSPSSGSVLQGISHVFDIPAGFSLQRVIMKAGLWGSMFYQNEGFVPMPASVGVSAALWYSDSADQAQYFYNKYTPCRYDLGWQQTLANGGKFYWTLSGTDLVDCDVAVRRKNTPDHANLQLAFELQVILGGELIQPGTELTYPAYQMLASIRYLTSHAV